jgi:hypothetical protein
MKRLKLLAVIVLVVGALVVVLAHIFEVVWPAAIIVATLLMMKGGVALVVITGIERWRGSHPVRFDRTKGIRLEGGWIPPQ